MYVVLIGNPVSGFNAFGPFASKEAADDWASAVEDHADEAVTIMSVDTPD